MESSPIAIGKRRSGAWVEPQATWQASLNGQDLTARFDLRLISVTITEKLGEAADELSIEIDDSDGVMAIPPSGTVLTLAMGWAKGTDVTPGIVPKGTFTMDEPIWGGPPDKLTLKGHSADLIAGFRTRKNRIWTNQTLDAIIGTIAEENGVAARCHPDLAGTVVTSAEQANASDMAFVRDLGRRYDAVATVKGGALIFAPRNAATTASGAALAAITVTRASCSDYSYNRPARDGAQDGAEAQFHDQDAATRKTVQAGGDTRRRLKRVYASKADATAAAKSESNRLARAKATFEVTLALGDPRIGPGIPATVSGFKSEIDATKWRVTTAEHTMGASGLSTRLTLEVAA